MSSRMISKKISGNRHCLVGFFAKIVYNRYQVKGGILLISVQEIARIANVSQSTVSKVLNGYSDVSQKTRDKVLAIANQLGYVPNAAAISLVKNKSNIIGVIYEVASGFSNLFFSSILEAFRMEAEASGYTLILLSQNANSQKTYWMQCLSHKIESVFIISTRDQSSVESELRTHGISVLTLDPMKESSNLIATDNIQAIRLSLDTLYQLGHRNIAFVQGALGTYVGKCRLNGYLDFIKEHQLPSLYIPTISNDSYSVQEGYDTTNALLDQFVSIDAIACCSDVLALGATYALQDRKLRIPEDVSVMGFDDLRLCEIVRPKLSTIHQDYYKLGKIACETLLTMKATTQLQPILVEASVVIRASTTKRL